MAKQLVFTEEARRSLQQGIDALSKAVKATMGPKGRNVAIEKKFGSPTVTHDGVTVAKEIELADPYENMGAQLLKEAATKTNEVAGDGTTTAVVLAQAMITEGLRNVAAGANPMLLKRGLEKAARLVSEEIRGAAIPVESKEEIAHVAAISANDPEIGQFIAEVMDKVGKDGVVTVEESKGIRFETEYVEGMQIDRGYISPYFVTNPDRMECVIEDASLLITDKKISSASDLVPALERILHTTKNLVIIAEDVENEAMATLVVNKLRGVLNCVAVKAPGFGDRRKAMLEDIAILTGGLVITEEAGRKLDSVSVDDLGHARRVVVTKDDMTIVEGRGTDAAIEARVKQIKNQIAETTSEFDREKLQERLAKLISGVAVIKVGAATEVELKEKKARVEDALSATRAAVEEGVIPGGGVIFLNALSALARVELGGDELTGAMILRRALEEPMRQIAANAGYEGAVVVQEVRRRQSDEKNINFGFDVMTGEYVDMRARGIVDPAKVARAALENASSVAGMILTTEALITDLPEREHEATPPMPEY